VQVVVKSYTLSGFDRLAYDKWRRILIRRLPSCRDGAADILDCGCGEGRLLLCLRQWFPRANLTGLDIDAEALEEARRRVADARFVEHSAEKLPFPDESHDVVFALHLVEHLRYPLRFIAEAARVLRCGGLLIIATPNPQCVSAKLLGKKWRGWNVEHINLHPPDYWRKAIRNAGFDILRDGTTGLRGLPRFNKMPLGLLSWVPQFVIGFLPWRFGESYEAVARKGNVGGESPDGRKK